MPGRSAPLEVRVLVDGSVVEAFAAGGRAAVTARGYPLPTGVPPTVGLFNDGAESATVLSVEAFVMAKARGPPLEKLVRRIHGGSRI